MEYSDFRRFFRSLYHCTCSVMHSNVNWSSLLLDRSITYHDSYTNTYLGLTSDARNMSGCPQYILEVTNNQNTSLPVYVMVSRHYTRYDDLLGNDHYKVLISLQVFETDGPRLMVKQSDAKEAICEEIVYTNIPYDMCPIKVAPGHHFYTIVLQTMKQDPTNLQKFGFTLQARFNSILTGCMKPINEYPQYHFNYRVAGKWEGDNAGGRSSLVSYQKNPMYSITLTRPTFIHIRLEVMDNSELCVYLRLLPRSDVEKGLFFHKNSVLSAEAFTAGASMLYGQVDPGEYVLVAATYEPGQFGKYIITSRSSLPLEMRPLQEKRIPLPMMGDDMPYVYSIIDSIDACVTGQSVMGPQGFRRAK